MRSALLSLCFFATVGIGCAATTGTNEGDVDATEDELRTTYGQLNETLQGNDIDRWFAVRSALVNGFDQICGDTICSGDYSNLTTVRLTCSSTRATQKMKDCLWVLGGNIDYVDGRTGKHTSEIRSFACHVPVAGNAKTMLDALSAAGDDALNTTIPGTSGSFYDALVTCFDGVVGAPPPNVTQTFYSELGDYLWNTSDTAGLAWMQTKRKLNEGFDQVCGDSFCEGEYSDISALRLACSINANTKRVSRCGWSFVGANINVDSRGQLKADMTTKKCSFAVGATADAFSTALAGDDPLNAPLPNSSSSIYDALIGCL